MGKAADFTRKTTKTPVLLYRFFLKLSMACGVYTAYVILTSHIGSGNLQGDLPQLFKIISVPVSFSIMGAIAYTFAYTIYKSNGNDYKSLLKRKPTLGYILMTFKLFVFILGLMGIIFGSIFVVEKGKIWFISVALGFIFCQLLHTQSFKLISAKDANKGKEISKKDKILNIGEFFSSHLSTFFENFAAGLLLIAMNIIYANAFSFRWCIYIIPPIVSSLISEVFYHFYNTFKNNRNRKSNYASAEIVDRACDFAYHALIITIILLVWLLLVMTETITAIVESNIYEKLIKVIPICISSITVSVLIYNNFIKKPKKDTLIFNPKPKVDDFRDELEGMFGKGSEAEDALDFVVNSMNRLNGYIRHNGDDYYVHPIAVAKIIIDNAKNYVDITTIASALLHDCIEDLKDCTKETLKEKFGEDIAETVELVSKKKGINYHISANMTDYLDKISKNPRASIVKVADRMNNNSTMEYSSESEKIYKSKETRQFYMTFIAKARNHDKDNKNFYDKAEEFFKKPIPNPDK